MRAKITINPELYIVAGNFGKLAEAIANDTIFACCNKAEMAVKSNFAECLRNMRSAFELIAYDFEIKHRMQMGSKDEYQTIFSTVASELKENTRSKDGKSDFKNVKHLLRNELNRRRAATPNFAKECDKVASAYFNYFPMDKAEYQYEKTAIDKMLFTFYARCSSASHNGKDVSYQECSNLFASFFKFVALLYSSTCNYVNADCLIKDYIPVSAKFYSRLGLDRDSNFKLYIKDQDDHIDYYMIHTLKKDEEESENRDRFALTNLWKNSYNTPQGVPMILDSIDNGYEIFYIYSFPTQPISLNEGNLATLSDVELLNIVRGLIEAIASLHHIKMPHRGLNPKAVRLSKIKDSYRVFIVDYGLIKDSTGSIGTVKLDTFFEKWREKQFLAPELFGMKQAIDWYRADIYSLGAMIRFVLKSSKNPNAKANKILDTLVKDMMVENFSLRPDIDRVKKQFEAILDVGKDIPYTLCVNKGGRNEQQDAAYIMGKEVSSEETYKVKGIFHDEYVFALFDGMGGLLDGKQFAQKMSYALGKIIRQNPLHVTSGIQEQYEKWVMDLAGVSESESREGGIHKAGATLALLLIKDDYAYVANVGDSRVYCLKDNELVQLSEDHRFGMSIKKKGELYQYLGMAQEEYAIDPYFATCNYEYGNRFLVCTDGLSDYVSDEEIATIMRRNLAGEICADTLVKKALENGSKDNISVIVIG